MDIAAPVKRVGSYSPARALRIWREVQRYPLIPMVVLLLVLIIPAAFAPLIAPHDPLDGQLSSRLTPPAWQEGGSWDYILGTDKQGRDILSRILHGAKYVLFVSLTVIVISGVIGVSLGLIAGYFGGRYDMAIMRGVDIALSIPAILLALAIVASRGLALAQ
jgi:peptide/nickel transport system permease protein